MVGSRRLGLRAVTSALAFILVGPGLGRDVRADDASEKAACAEKYQSAQRLRAAGKLTLARADLLRCAEQSCPAFVSTDCKTWLAQVESDLPTLVFAVLDPDGRDVPSAVIRVDGVEIPHATDGLGHVFDPGERSIQVIAGEQRLTQRIVARAGEKSRRVELRLAGPVAPPANVTYTPGEPAPAPARPPVPVLAYVLGGVGVAAVVTGSVLWATGSSAAHTYNDDCTSGAGCTQAQRTSAARQLVAGDLLWAAGLAAGAAAVVIVLQPRASASAQVSGGTGGVVLSGAF
jgi:hypothetical protein